jgi:hypothetical protein
MLCYLLAHSTWDNFEFNKTLKSESELIDEIHRDLPGAYSLYTFNLSANDFQNTASFINLQTNEGQDGKYSRQFYTNICEYLTNTSKVNMVYKPDCPQSMEWIPV